VEHILTNRRILSCLPQAAFIYGGATVRDNILFGLPFDEERYNHAIEVACLVDDLLQMPGEPFRLACRGFLVAQRTDRTGLPRDHT
jgi:ABC-type multidrug transport system fused ATPase/permease subunit